MAEKERIIVLNNAPEDSIRFVRLLKEKLVGALGESEDREWTMGILDDVITMCSVVKDAMVEEEPKPKEHRLLIPVNKGGVKS